MTTEIKATKTFIIRHKGTKEIWTSSSGKAAWKAINHSKAAWANSNHENTVGIKAIERKATYSWGDREWVVYPKFNDQDVYEVVEVKPESEDKLQDACKLLERCINETPFLPDTNLGKQITRFIKENKIENQ